MLMKYKDLGRLLGKEEQKKINGGSEGGGSNCILTLITDGTTSYEIFAFTCGCPEISTQANNRCVDLVINTSVDRCYYNCGC